MGHDSEVEVLRLSTFHKSLKIFKVSLLGMLMSHFSLLMGVSLTIVVI